MSSRSSIALLLAAALTVHALPQDVGATAASTAALAQVTSTASPLDIHPVCDIYFVAPKNASAEDWAAAGCLTIHQLLSFNPQMNNSATDGLWENDMYCVHFKYDDPPSCTGYNSTDFPLTKYDVATSLWSSATAAAATSTAAAATSTADVDASETDTGVSATATETGTGSADTTTAPAPTDATSTDPASTDPASTEAAAASTTALGTTTPVSTPAPTST